MSVDFGSDFEAPGELLPDMRLLENEQDKTRAFLASVARGLNMPRGALWFSPNDGLSISEFVADIVDKRVASQQINAECLKDERVARAETAIVGTAEQWDIKTTVFAKDGSVYQLVFRATADSAALLSAERVQ